MSLLEKAYAKALEKKNLRNRRDLRFFSVATDSYFLYRGPVSEDNRDTATDTRNASSRNGIDTMEQLERYWLILSLLAAGDAV